jgi:hypothetical protein
MLRHLGKDARTTLLSIINDSWRTGKVPPNWKMAQIIPIHKKREEQSESRWLQAHQPVELHREVVRENSE